MKSTDKTLCRHSLKATTLPVMAAFLPICCRQVDDDLEDDSNNYFDDADSDFYCYLMVFEDSDNDFSDHFDYNQGDDDDDP